MAASIQALPQGIHAETPRELFNPGVPFDYDVTPDGRRFLMVQDKERPATAAAEMILVQNWIEELKARVPTR